MSIWTCEVIYQDGHIDSDWTDLKDIVKVTFTKKGKTMNENINALDTLEGVPSTEGVPEFLARDPKDLEVQVERTQEDLEAVDPQNTVH